MAGLSNLWFDPKDNDGNPLPENETGLYEKLLRLTISILELNTWLAIT